MTDHYDDDEDYYCTECGLGGLLCKCDDGPAFCTEDPRNDVADAAVEWWKGRRPVGWTEEQHLGNPRINCVTARESNLAMRVAEFVAFDRGIKALQ